MAWLTTLLLCFQFFPLSSKAISDSSYVFIRVRNKRSGQETQACGNYQQWKQQALQENAVWHRLFSSSKLTMTSLLLLKRREKRSTVYPLAYRASVSPQQRLLTIQKLGDNVGAGLFLVGNNSLGIPDLLFAGFSDGSLQGFPIPVFFVYEKVFDERLVGPLVGNNSGDLEIQFFQPHPVAFDPCILVLFGIAFFCVSAGGFWSGQLTAQEFLLEIASHEEENETDEGAFSSNYKCWCLQVLTSWAEPCTFLILVCAILILTYYFYIYMIWLFITWFVFASWFSLFVVSASLASHFLKTEPPCLIPFSAKSCLPEKFQSFCPLLLDQLKLQDFILWLASGSISLTWFLTRKSPYSFILGDILGIVLIVYALETLRQFNLKQITSLMILFFCYDFFMVFVSPFLTSDGCSIMEEAATGGGCVDGQERGLALPPRHTDSMPMAFRVPRFSDPMLSCYDLRVDLEYPGMLLGFGDVFLPGLLSSYCFTLDLTSPTSKYFGYSVAVMTAYAAGLVVTFLALIFTNSGQPALVYILPLTLGAVCLTALLKKEFWKVWIGDVAHFKEIQGYEMIPEAEQLEMETIPTSKAMPESDRVD